nr:serine/threonine-protein kinase spe-6-like [Penaeus vannamei]
MTHRPSHPTSIWLEVPTLLAPGVYLRIFAPRTTFLTHLHHEVILIKDRGFKRFITPARIFVAEHEVERVYEGPYAVVDVVQNADPKIAIKKNKSVRKKRREVTLREAAVLATLDGKAGAPRLICTDPDKGIIVTEYLGPNTLHKVIRSRRQLRDRTWLKVLYSCAEKLQELHQAGFVHADLNIKNVMITYKQGNPTAHIIDFGFARKIGLTGQFVPVPDWEKMI